MFAKTKLAHVGDSGLMVPIFNSLMGLYLLANLLVRFSTMFHYPPYNGYIAVFLGCLVAGCVFVIFFKKYLKVFLFLFGFSFFLFGFPSMDVQSRIFELIVTCVAMTLVFINYKKRKEKHSNKALRGFLFCYVALSLFSLLLLPVRHILRDLWLFGFSNSIFYVFIGQPFHTYYPIPAINRLILYVILAVQLASLGSRTDAYKSIFMGLFSGGIFCAFIGILDFYGLISLKWYRLGRTSTPGVLHSTFGNRGVFGEFILTVVPFVLIGFLSKTKRIWVQVFLFGSLVICEIALILAGARAGWVSYPLILSICWFFFYFSKEGRIESLHFKWKDLIKIAVSVPLTILISFLLIFQVFMPLSDYLKTRYDVKGIQKDGAVSTQYLKKRAALLMDPGRKGGRLYTWTEGYHVGRESPLFGMGYESFCWHAHVLGATPGSHLNAFYPKTGRYIHFTPHSTFFQLFVSGGLVGLCFWLMIIGYALVILLFDLIRNKRLLNIPVIISIIGFHTYGVFQSMQYMSMIWCIVFLNLGYAMTVDEKVIPNRIQGWVNVAGKVSVFLVIIGFFVYLSNFESSSLARKYGKRIYAMDQDRDRFSGFFQPSKRWIYGRYRWFGKKGTVSVPGGGAVALVFHCRTPGLEKDPVILKVFHNGRVLDEVVFSEKKGGRTVTRKYDLPPTPGKEQKLLLEVSRTWIPHQVLGNFDRRKLGLGVNFVKDKGNKLR